MKIDKLNEQLKKFDIDTEIFFQCLSCGSSTPSPSVYLERRKHIDGTDYRTAHVIIEQGESPSDEEIAEEESKNKAYELMKHLKVIPPYLDKKTIRKVRIKQLERLEEWLNQL